MHIGDKVIKLHEERELLGRFLIIQTSRPSLVPKLEETIGDYEMSVVPRSLCAVDGTLYIPTDKASVMHAVEDAKAEPLQVLSQPRLVHEDLPVVPQPDQEKEHLSAAHHPDLMQEDPPPVPHSTLKHSDPSAAQNHDLAQENPTVVLQPDLMQDNLSAAAQDELVQEGPSVKVLIVDAMGILQSMTKTPTMLKLSDLQNAFHKRIENMMAGYDEGRVVFDRYLEQSLKNKTRQKRATTCVQYEVHPQMKLIMSIKELLSASSTKKKLTCMLGQGRLEYFSKDLYSSLKLVVVYDTFIKGHDFEEMHTHEEADTLIPHQVIASAATGTLREINVWSPDTDVLLLLVDLVSWGHIAAPTSLKFVTGKGSKKREIDIFERVLVIGHHKCQGLLGLHNFSGADWGGKFVGISKKTWANAYLKLDDDDPAIDCFKELGEVLIPPELINGELPVQVKGLEEFVCRVYSSTGPKSLPSLRWELFRSKHLEGEMLPPTRAALLPHILRANYIMMRDRSYQTNCPALPPIEENGWTSENGVILPVRCLALPAPRAVLELIKCGCKAGCKGRCSCSNNDLPCTPLCKCYSGDCANQIREDVSADIDDED